MKTEELLVNLKEDAYKLLRYCHSENCDTIEQCPRKCCPDKRLCLATAVAWTTGNKILEFVDNFEYYDAAWVHREALTLHRILVAMYEATELDVANNPNLHFLMEKAFCTLTRLVNRMEVKQ